MKKILIVLFVLGQFAVADNINSWCGYNGNFFEKFQNDILFKKYVGLEKDNSSVIFVSSFNKDTIKKIRARYKEAKYDVKYLKNSMERDWKLKKGFWFAALNSIFPQNKEIEKEWKYSETGTTIVQAILLAKYKNSKHYLEYLEHTQHVMSLFAFSTYDDSNDWVYVNPMISLANIYVSMDDPDNSKLDRQAKELKNLLKKKAGICE